MVTKGKMTDASFQTVSEHSVQFFETDTFLVNSVSEFIETGLRAGDACIVFATQPHREGIQERLAADGLNVSAALAQGQYVPFDAAATLSQFMVDGSPEPERFAEIVGDVIAEAAQGGRSVRIFGELVALLWADGNRTATVRLEELWNELSKTFSFSLFCAYPVHGFDGEIYEAQFTEICNQHSHVIPDENYTALSNPHEQLRVIALLQQKANSLEAEIVKRRELERRKDEFISMASHELKTPVTALKGFTQLLLRRFKSRNDEESIRFLARMDSQINKLTKLISDMLDISKMQSGQLEYRMEPFDLAALAQEIVENVQGTIQTHLLILEKPPKVQVFGDRDRIGQVLINLLTNAMKYSPDADTVIVRIAIDGGNVLLSVQDFGIGIAEAYQKKIFEQFYQVNEPAEKTYPGLGIGLYIACKIIERHQGKLWVQSRKGEGATFSFCLPILDSKN
jgi:signal transduction histidine kinase